MNKKYSLEEHKSQKNKDRCNFPF